MVCTTDEGALTSSGTVATTISVLKSKLSIKFIAKLIERLGVCLNVYTMCKHTGPQTLARTWARSFGDLIVAVEH